MTPTKETRDSQVEEPSAKSEQTKSDERTPRVFDLQCKECDEVIALRLVDVAKANRLHKEHAEENGCEPFYARFVPISESPGYEFYKTLMDAVKQSSDETVEEVKANLDLPEGGKT